MKENTRDANSSSNPQGSFTELPIAPDAPANMGDASAFYVNWGYEEFDFWALNGMNSKEQLGADDKPAKF
jgi:hypothetical protein